MSGGIGITFQPNASLHLAIENLVPNGPAYNSGRCHKDDVLTRIDDQVGICVGICQVLSANMYCWTHWGGRFHAPLDQHPGSPTERSSYNLPRC